MGHYHVHIATQNKHDHYNKSNLIYNSIRPFATNKEDDPRQHDDSYLDIDEMEQDQDDQSSKTKKWKSTHPQTQKQRKSGITTSKEQTPGFTEYYAEQQSLNTKSSKWGTIKSVMNKPF